MGHPLHPARKSRPRSKTSPPSHRSSPAAGERTPARRAAARNPYSGSPAQQRFSPGCQRRIGGPQHGHLYGDARTSHPQERAVSQRHRGFRTCRTCFSWRHRGQQRRRCSQVERLVGGLRMRMERPAVLVASRGLEYTPGAPGGL
ncbi:hypothetical protein I553_10728 [Mycobacterium xenopi 4042]|uniref:Uncharacterized protein n=1 Tax=Mycobacterium xenopi 4042 TaxID=1299334 RepID=X8DBJ7_MYCXE|nr:hypothetical protein I553_10728 [Mycobacterium xenopi 4042]